MSAMRALDQYLDELGSGLPAVGRLRSRVLTEAEDHLREDIAARRAAGIPVAEAQEAALSAFGPAGLVARSINEGAAKGAVRRVFILGAVLFAAVIVGSDLVTSDFARVAGPWLKDGPGTLIIWVIAQVALVAGAVSVIRAVAYTLSRAGTAQLYIVRGMLVVVLCAALTLPIDGIGVLSAPGGLRPAYILLVIAAIGASVTAAACAGWWALRATACLRYLGISQPPDTTIAGDLCGAARRLYRATQRRFPGAAPSLRITAQQVTAWRTRVVSRAPWLPEWLDSRRHPWRFAFLAMAPLAALTVLYGLVQGILIARGAATWDSASFPLLLAAIECLLALTGYAMLGPYLGLR